MAHNESLSDMLGLPTAAEVGRANEWFSFICMAVGWFLILTSLGGWWRVKRFERGLRNAQRESEAAQAEAAAGRGEGQGDVSNLSTTSTTTNTGNEEVGPRDPRYYTNALRDWAMGLRDIQRGFYGMRGRPVGGNQGGRDGNGEGDEHELLDAQGFGLGPMSRDDGDGSGGGGGVGESRRTRPRGLWGV